MPVRTVLSARICQNIAFSVHHLHTYRDAVLDSVSLAQANRGNCTAQLAGPMPTTQSVSYCVQFLTMVLTRPIRRQAAPIISNLIGNEPLSGVATAASSPNRWTELLSSIAAEATVSSTCCAYTPHNSRGPTGGKGTRDSVGHEGHFQATTKEPGES